jgi:hypothetical protein
MKTPRLTFTLLIATLLAPVAAQAGHPGTGVAAPAKPRASFAAPATVRNRARGLVPVGIGRPSKSKPSHTAEVDGTHAGHRH